MLCRFVIKEHCRINRRLLYTLCSLLLDSRAESTTKGAIAKLQVDRAEKEEGQGEGGLAPSSAGCSAGASGSRMGPGPDSGSSAPSSVPQSLATSRDDEDDEDEESSGRRSNGHGGSRLVRATSSSRLFVPDCLARFISASSKPAREISPCVCARFRETASRRDVTDLTKYRVPLRFYRDCWITAVSSVFNVTRFSFSRESQPRDAL